MKEKAYDMLGISIEKELSSNDKILIIIDDFEHIGDAIKNENTRNDALNLFHKLQELNDTKRVNIVAIGYDSIFKDQLVKEAGLKHF
jgi:archaellum biogenesis ATPase FlaH